MADNTCSICVEAFHPTQRRPVVCFQCGHDPEAPKQCSKCVETYLLQCFDDPKCMHCRAAWSRPFIFRTLPKRFHKDFDAHMRNVLEQRERCNFPTTVPLVEMRRQVQATIKEVKEAQAALYAATRRLANARQTHTDMVDAERNLMMQHIDPTFRAAEADPEAVRNGGGENFHRPCAAEECVGFVSSRTGVCITCEKTTCLRCNAAGIDKEAHECVEADVATWEALRKETKPCPTCSSRIFKISGCDQMWCPQCHTAFRWSTGQVDRGAVHNPHYYEWLFSEQGRNGGAAPAAHRRAGGGATGACVDPMPSVIELRNAMIGLKNVPGSDIESIRVFHRAVLHHREVSLTQLATKYPRTGVQSLRGQIARLRVEFLSNSISADKFRTAVHRVTKDFEKMAEYEQIVRTYVAIQSDTMRVILNHLIVHKTTPSNESRETIRNLIREMQKHRERANSSVMELNSAFNSNSKSILL